MNDRIRLLYEQAHSIRHHDGDPMRGGNPPTVYWEGETSAEKFAQLIVKECANWMCDDCDEEGDGIGDSYYWAKRMTKHFGVDNK